jgi:hypothetical protein
VRLQQVRRPFDILICRLSVFHFPACSIKIPSATNEEHYGNKQMLLIEFQVSSTTNEKHYGNKQTLCLNFKFRVQQMKSNMGKSFALALAFAFNP